MSIKTDIAAEKIRIGKAVVKSKLGAAIASRILNPILDSIEKEMDDTAHWVGEFIVAHLRQNILANQPSGREYEVVLVSGGGDKNSYTSLGKYTASAEGEPPASFESGLGVPTGTLFASISFEIGDNGHITVGVFDSTGTEYSSLFYRAGKIFVSNSGEGRSTPVEVYANALDKGASGGGWSVGPRPWFGKVIEELRPEIRKKIREKLKKALKRATRSKGGRTAIYFRVYFNSLQDNSGSIQNEEWWED
jgi:hypothetical protein